MVNINQLIDDLSTFKVLYVEDNLVMQAKTQQLFENFFQKVDIASNGKEALDLYEKEVYEIVISDIDMPVMNGIDMAQKIRAINPEQPIIFVTAYTDTDYLLESIKLCVDGYILKPFSLEQVKEILFQVAQRILYKRESELYCQDLKGEVDQRTEQLELSRAKLQQEHDRLEAIFNTSKDGIALLDLETNFLDFNDAYLEMTGFSREELLTKSCVGLSVEADKAKHAKVLEEARTKGYVEGFEKACIVNNDKRIEVSLTLALMPNKIQFIASARDITESKRTLRKMEKYLELIDQNIISTTTDLHGIITETSQAFSDICGYTKEELIGGNFKRLRDPDTSKDVYKHMWKVLHADGVWKGEIKNRTKDGESFWFEVSIFPIFDDNGVKVGYNSIRNDVTDKKRIERLSITDSLTGLYNRRYFDKMYSKIINSAKRNDCLVCFVMFDIDYFKLYNDTYGHQEGDKVLEAVSESILHSLKRSDDYAFRLGGEEFGVLFKSENRDEAIEFAKSLKQNVEELKIEHSKSFVGDFVSISVGLVCRAAKEIEDLDHLYKEVDDLLYKAKEKGRNRIEIAQS